MGSTGTESSRQPVGEGLKYPGKFSKTPNPEADAQSMQAAMETTPSLSSSSSLHPTARPCSFPTPVPAAAQVATSSHLRHDDAPVKAQEDSDSQLAATNTPRATESVERRAYEDTEPLLPSERSPPAEAEPLEPPAAVAQNNSRRRPRSWLYIFATFLCCSFWQRQEDTSPEEPISVETQENLNTEEEEDGEIPQEGTVSTAELLMYGDFILKKEPWGPRPRPSPKTSHRTSRTKEQQQPRENDAIPRRGQQTQGESERQRENQQRFLLDDDQELQREPSGSDEGAPAGGICSSLFSPCSRGQNFADERASSANANRQGKDASSSHSGPREGATSASSNNVRCRSLRRVRDESRQTWMEYQQVTLDDNSKRLQWVDIGDD